jgi:DNA-binding FrmR family transcriptional regulator
MRAMVFLMLRSSTPRQGYRHTGWCIFRAHRRPGGRVSDPKLHDPEAKKAMDARLARIEGQVRAVRRMIGEDEPCEDIAQQLAAARKALDRAFYEMVSCMIRQEPPPGNLGRSERAGRVAELLARFG